MHDVEKNFSTDLDNDGKFTEVEKQNTTEDVSTETNFAKKEEDEEKETSKPDDTSKSENEAKEDEEKEEKFAKAEDEDEKKEEDEEDKFSKKEEDKDEEEDKNDDDKDDDDKLLELIQLGTGAKYDKRSFDKYRIDKFSDYNRHEVLVFFLNIFALNKYYILLPLPFERVEFIPGSNGSRIGKFRSGGKC